MGTLGWVILVGAFLILMMVANNSWSAVWQKISGVTTTSGNPPALSGETTASGQPVVTGPVPSGNDPASFPPTPEVTPQNPGRILVPNPSDPSGPPLEVFG
jgi:hypothetical protein